MSMEYIRKTYGVPAKRGARIKFKAVGGGSTGTIVGSRGGHIRVRFDGRTTILSLHPTWEVEYLGGGDA